MTTPPVATARRAVRRVRAAAAAALIALGAALLAPATAAHAAAGVSVTSTLGDGRVDAEYATAITVSGSGFQSVQGGFGGIYVLFGWVDPAGWKPSEGGVVGDDYLYIPDSESKDNQGYQRFVSFPGSETEASAQAVIDASGSWSVQMTVPGPQFQALDRSGNATTVDCLSVQCGVITFGAHGVKNAANETFTPVEFVVPEAGAEAPATEAATGSDASAASGDAADSADAAPGATAQEAVAIGDLRLGIGTGTLTAGDVLSFTARGFAAGEQVVATLDGGVSAVGPLAAGAAGEVAGVLQLPADLAAGTHLVTVTGAATEGVVETEITVAANAVAGAAAATESGAPAWVITVMLVAVALAAVLVVANVVTAIVRAARARRARTAVTA
ncbi:hypothetical protein [Microbacterium sp. NPDC055683]